MIKKFLAILIITIFFYSCDTKTDDPLLSIGLMPAVDTAPFFYAQKEGFFEDEGITVEFTIYTNAQNRQTALQTNRIDGAMTDLVALIINVDSGFPIKGTLSTDGLFPLLVNPESNLMEKPEIGMMEVSVSNYLVEQYMGNKAYSKVYINEIPLRLEAVGANKIAMGLFPEPVASLGVLKGLEKQIFKGIPKESLDIMVFTQKAIKEKKKSLKAFHRAYSRAVEILQKDEELSKSIIMEFVPNLPPGIKDSILLPVYHSGTLPSKGFLRELINWTEKTMGREISLTPEELVDTQFIK